MREKENLREMISNLYDIFNKHYINLNEYAQYLNKSYEWVRKAIEDKTIPGQKKGREYIIPIRAIALYEMRLGECK